MAPKPIFAATHPRACSTAFERVFLTRRDIMDTAHEPFGDPAYFGPERLCDRFRNDAETRHATGMADITYKDVLDSLQEPGKRGRRVFIKDMAQYLIAPHGRPTSIAQSLGAAQEPGNPTVLPIAELKKFHFTFLIRHPRRSIPSYWRCTIPPRKEVTGWDYFDPAEAGYAELVTLFKFLDEQGIIDKSNVTVIDADDMLDNPEGIIRAYCDKTDIDFKDTMLNWNKEDDKYAQELFEKWNGWHDDALQTSCLQARAHPKKVSTIEMENKEWEEKFGSAAQKVIRQTVDDNVPHYDYLKQFAITV